MSTSTISLWAASSWLVMGPGTESPTGRLSTMLTGSMRGLVLEKNTSSAV